MLSTYNQKRLVKKMKQHTDYDKNIILFHLKIVKI